jgi:PhoPQ-activated pathogenicity-related protein
VVAFYDVFLRQQPRPEFTWKFEDDGSIRVTPGTIKPIGVKLWQATNPEHRDFRLVAIGPAYHATTLHPEPDGTYVAKVEQPEKGWTAYFVELTFATGGKYPLKFTTGVRITPDTLPFAAPKYSTPRTE